MHGEQTTPPHFGMRFSALTRRLIFRQVQIDGRICRIVRLMMPVPAVQARRFPVRAHRFFLSGRTAVLPMHKRDLPAHSPVRGMCFCVRPYDVFALFL